MTSRRLLVVALLVIPSSVGWSQQATPSMEAEIQAWAAYCDRLSGAGPDGSIDLRSAADRAAEIDGDGRTARVDGRPERSELR